MTPEIQIFSAMQQKLTVLLFTVLGFCALLAQGFQPESQAAADCAQVLSSASHMNNEEKQTLCRLYQSSTALAQLGSIVTDSLERFMASQALTPEQADKTVRLAKRKHEYLRFGRK